MKMSEYEFILGQVVRTIRASDLEDIGKKILIYEVTNAFEKIHEYIAVKNDIENQKRFKKEED